MRRASVCWALVAASLGIGALAALFGLSEWKLRRLYDAPLEPLRARRAADLENGRRMARIVGCWAGCHGPRGEGGGDSIAGIHQRTAPTLSAILPTYSDEELVRLIRYGVKRDGKSAVGMIPQTFWAIGDQDLVDIIAHLRAQPALEPIPFESHITLRGRWALITGRWKVAAEQVDPSRPRWGEMPRQTPFERGRYLASITCSECHGLDFMGNELEAGPALTIGAGYPPEAFHHLMRTAQALDGRIVEAMDWLQDVPFTDQEINDIHSFLRGRFGLSEQRAP